MILSPYQKREDFLSMRKNNNIPKESNDVIDIYLANNEVKNMADIEKMMSSFFGPAIPKK